MGIITLTDRISVSVRAKNETESNSQKRATGRNIANALTSGGNANISDSLADQLGNTSKPTIADEQGREWVAMSDIIAAGKKMKENGAFDEKEVHEGIDSNGIIYNVNEYIKGFTHLYSDGSSITETAFGNIYKFRISGNSAVWKWYSSDAYGIGLDIVKHYPESSANYINDGTYAVIRKNSDGNIDNCYWPKRPEINQPQSSNANFYVDTTYINGTEYKLYSITRGSMISPDGPNVEALHDSSWYTNVLQKIAGFLYGPTHTSGGSLIDWTKSDAEIEEDIRNLHETWDVTEHAGSVNANGTYVLAGPIEFNPGD